MEGQKLDYFMHLDLPVYGKVGLIEGKAIHFFNALSKSNLDMGKTIKFLVLELLVVNGGFVDEEFLDEMSLKDAAYLTSIVGTMMDDKFKI